MLSSPGIGSGLDINSIVDQLMAIERQPLVRLNTRQVEVQAQISGFGQLKSSFSSFRSAMEGLADANKFKVYSARSSDDDVLSASASATAARGSYGIEVRRIAENHRLAAATAFADTGSTVIGSSGDTMTLQVGADAFTVDYGGRTLGEIRDAINAATDNPGVTATILRDDTGNHLVLAANETGSGRLITPSYSAADPFGFATLNTDRNGDAGFTAADLDAELLVEGQFTVTSKSNTISDAIEGVTLTAAKAGTVTMSVDRDTAAVEKSVQAFVKGYNDLVSIMGKLRSDVLKAERGSLVAIESQLRNVLNQPAQLGDGFTLLFEIGIRSTASGTLELDRDIFQRALTDDFDAVSRLFADSSQGFAVRYEDMASRFLDADGMLDARTTSLKRQADDLDARSLSMQRRLVSVEEGLLKQYTALDTLMSQLNTTSDFLTQQLSLLQRSAAGGNR
ncbi:MAG: flagellar filament capping protein FliD [Gammaproteobacteria bacterium]|nr:flagellar filament capping protein FliD [Gammaproteobacteria bacterium]